jgi:hypothetical protein
MKTKIYSILFFALTFSYALFLVSCQKTDKPCVHGTTEKNILTDDLAKVPYKDNTKLTFIRTSTNDTFTFTAQGWKTDFGTTQTQEDCYQNYSLQRKWITFSSITYPQPINVTFQYYDAQGNDYLEIDFNNNLYIVFPSGVRKPYEYDSLVIQQKKYYNIRYFKNEYKPEYNTAYGCYYNVEQGIIKMETSDKDKWELLRVQ